MGRTARVNGKSAEISVDKYIGGTAQILGIVTKGRDDPTAAEKEREDVVLEILQGTMSFFSLPLVQQILRESSPNQTRTLSTPVGAVDLGDRTLNNSQATAVYQITSDDPNDQLVLVHGPPGTGKTTVIASSVIELVNTQKSRGIWLVAQSNIAVKNIAEKLADVDFLDFKILVSQDFHFEWYALSTSFSRFALRHRAKTRIIGTNTCTRRSASRTSSAPTSSPTTPPALTGYSSTRRSSSVPSVCCRPRA